MEQWIQCVEVATAFLDGFEPAAFLARGVGREVEDFAASAKAVIDRISDRGKELAQEGGGVQTADDIS